MNRFNTDLNIIAGLSDAPVADGSYTVPQFKAKFDEAANLLKNFLNNTIIPALESGTGVKAERWKTARAFTITDGENSVIVNVDGSGDVTFTLPAVLHASVDGSAASAVTAEKLKEAVNIGGAAFDGSGDITLASMGAAEVDANGKVSPQQAASRIVEVPDVSRSLALSDAGCMLMARNGADSSQAGYTLTIPAHASAAFPIGTEIEVMQYDAGSVTIQAAADVYLYYPGGPTTAGGSISIGDRYGVVSLKKIYENHWLAAGCIG